MRSSALRGYNGNLIVGNDAVLIRRGLRGVLARKRRDPDLQIPFDEVAAVRFAPSGWLVGYLQIIERGASVGSSGYLTTIRDHRTVTFLTRSGRWRRAAEEVADRSGVSVEVEAAAPYWRAMCMRISLAASTMRSPERSIMTVCSVPVNLKGAW